MPKHCLECGEEFMGRIDKKFCSDQCRNSFHNRENGATINYVRKINRVLRRNRRILESLLPGDKATVRKSKLEKLGFDFRYVTQLYVTHKDNSTYYFCYEYGYLPIDNGRYVLVKRENEPVPLM